VKPDDLKVFAASFAGVGNWMVEIDLILKIGISTVSLIYVSKKTLDLFSKKK
jgi:hypothetical protein